MTAAPAFAAFDEQRHEYTHGGRVIPGTTSILRATKFYQVPAWITDPKYKQLGKGVHLATQLYDLGIAPAQPYHADVASRQQKYAEFKRDTGFQGKVWELPLIDTQRGYAGTIDTLGIVPSGDIWLVDVKTGTVPVVGVSMQLAGYYELILNGKVIPVPRHASLPLDLEWFEWARTQHSRIRRKSLNLTAEKYTLRSHDELRWVPDWRAALRTYNAWQEHGL